MDPWRKWEVSATKGSSLLGNVGKPLSVLGRVEGE